MSVKSHFSASPTGQQQTAGDRCQGCHRNKAKGADNGADDLRRHIFIVEHHRRRRALGHEYHQQGNATAGVGQKQRCSGGATGPTAHGEVGSDDISNARF